MGEAGWFGGSGRREGDVGVRVLPGSQYHLIQKAELRLDFSELSCCSSNPSPILYAREDADMKICGNQCISFFQMLIAIRRGRRLLKKAFPF